MQYAKRESLLEKGERVWRIEPDALVMTRPGGGEGRLPWATIRDARVAYAPTQYKTWRHALTLTGPGGRMVIDNGHFVGVGNFEDRSSTFTPFAAAVLDEVAAKSPDARLHIGMTPLIYTLQMATMIVGLVAMVGAIVLLPIPLGPIWIVIGLKLVVMAFLLPYAIIALVKARPRGASLEAVKAALPKP